MKVDIGPYIGGISCRIHEDHLWKKYGVDYLKMPAKDFDSTDRFMEKLDDVVQWIYDHTTNLVLERMKRKIKVKIHDYDIWSADSTIGLIVLPMLKKLKEEKQGGPLVDDEDVPDHLKRSNTDKANSWDTDEHWFPRWEYVIDEMIFAFDSLYNDWEEQYHSGYIDFLHIPVDKDGNRVEESEAEYFEAVKGPKDTHVFDKEGYEKHEKRIQKGFELFGKYYRCLWS